MLNDHGLVLPYSSLSSPLARTRDTSCKHMLQTEIETRSQCRSQTRTPRSRLDMNLNHAVQSESNSDLDSPYMYSKLYLAHYFVV